MSGALPIITADQRLADDPTHRDSLVDVIGYAALMPEGAR